jgi:hypothetical protein
LCGAEVLNSGSKGSCKLLYLTIRFPLISSNTVFRAYTGAEAGVVGELSKCILIGLEKGCVVRMRLGHHAVFRGWVAKRSRAPLLLLAYRNRVHYVLHDRIS